MIARRVDVGSACVDICQSHWHTCLHTTFLLFLVLVTYEWFPHISIGIILRKTKFIILLIDSEGTVWYCFVGYFQYNEIAQIRNKTLFMQVNARKLLDKIKLYIRQSNSSLPSGQSLLLLHHFDRLTQVWLSLHLNSPGRQSTSLVTSNTSSHTYVVRLHTSVTSTSH